MCDALRELMKDDLIQSERTGERNGERNATFQNIKSVMEAFSVNAEQAMDALKVPADDRELYRARL